MATSLGSLAAPAPFAKAPPRPLTLQDLPPELRRYGHMDHLGLSLYHPLCEYQSIESPRQVATARTMIEHRRGMLSRALAEGDHGRALWLHERYARLEYVASLSSDESVSDYSYWALVAAAYVDQEFPTRKIPLLRTILRCPRRGRRSLGDEEEAQAFAALAYPLTVYRGTSSGHEDKRPMGCSWTTDERVARWFAWRFADHERPPVVWRARVTCAEHIAAYWTRREESEALIVEPLSRVLRDVERIDPGEEVQTIGWKA